MTGRIREEKVPVFKNKCKETEKHPGYVAMSPTEDESGSIRDLSGVSDNAFTYLFDFGIDAKLRIDNGNRGLKKGRAISDPAPE